MPLIIVTHPDPGFNGLCSYFSEYAGDIFNLARVSPDDFSLRTGHVDTSSEYLLWQENWVKDYFSFLLKKIKDSEKVVIVEAHKIVNSGLLLDFLNELRAPVHYVMRKPRIEAVYHNIIAKRPREKICSTHTFFASYHECVGAPALVSSLLPAAKVYEYSDFQKNQDVVLSPENHIKNQEEVGTWYRNIARI